MRGLTSVAFPVVIRNYARIEQSCATKEELFEFLVNAREGVSTLTLINAARLPDLQAIHPTYFLDDLSARLLSIYQQFKRYGMAALFSDSDPPAGVLHGLDIIQNTLDRIEYQKYRRLKEQDKQ